MRALSVFSLLAALGGCAQIFGIEDPFLDVSGDLFIDSVDRSGGDIAVVFCRDGGVASGGAPVDVEIADRLSGESQIVTAEIPDSGQCSEARVPCSQLGAINCRARFELEVAVDPADEVPERVESNNGLSRILLQVAAAFVSSAEVAGLELGSAFEADLLCQQLAAGAGLPGGWSAWLSDFNVDVLGRLSVTDIVVTRVDETVLAPSLEVLLRDQALAAPLDRDETGAPVSAGTCAWTGTDPGGFLLGECGGWGTSEAQGSFGEVGRVDGAWSFAGDQSCEQSCRIYCLERGVRAGPGAVDLFVGSVSRGGGVYNIELCNGGFPPQAPFDVPILVLNSDLQSAPLHFPPVPDAGVCQSFEVACSELGDVDCGRAIDLVIAVDPFDDIAELDEGNNIDGMSLGLVSARAFVSGSTFTGDGLGGVGGADGLCQSEADSFGLGGDFRAWVSDAASDPDTTFVQHAVPYAMVDGTVIAASYADLVDGTLEAEFVLQADGGSAQIEECVWTGTASDGSASGTDCDGWTNPSGAGVFGSVGAIDGGWTDVDGSGCDAPCRIYCFEQ